MHRRWWTVSVVAVLVITLALAAYFIGMPKANSDTLEDVKAAIGRHYVLDSKEEPALITVVDASKLSSVALKDRVENGDKILIYKSLQKAIIYRPSIDRIIDITPVEIDTPKSKL